MARIFVDFIPVVSEAGSSEIDCLSEEAFERQVLELNAELSHHLRDVLRLEVGRQLTVVSRQSGTEYLAIIAEALRDQPLKIKILRSIERTIPVPVIVTLACGLPKGSHADQICEQVAQLGVEQIIFWCADRSIVQPKQVSSKLERWQKIAEASARQSKQNSIPSVKYFASSSDFYNWIKTSTDLSRDMLAVSSLSTKASPMASVPAPQGRVHLIVGPEGDFSPEELATFDSLGATQVSLGPLVLRVETAALVSVSMGLALWGWR